jgi:predicted DNA-binding protein
MVWGRVSVDVRRRINGLSDELGIPRSRVVAALLEAGLADLDNVRFPLRNQTDQQELPLTQAS